MAIRYRCPNCQQLLSVATRMAGRPTKCPSCRTEHSVPPAEPAAEFAQVPPEPTPPAPRVEKYSTRPPEAKPSHGDGHPSASGGPSIETTFATDPIGERPHHGDDEEEDEGLAITGIERKSDELDLIPMVDCVFLLLVFYMITASYALQKTIDMSAPAPEKKGAMQAVQSADDMAQSSIVVQIDAQNRIFVDDVQIANVADLADTLRAKMNGDQKNELIIRADPNALHETEVAVTDAAHDLPFQHVRMAVSAADTD